MIESLPSAEQSARWKHKSFEPSSARERRNLGFLIQEEKWELVL
jgi:hypothetical protein